MTTTAEASKLTEARELKPIDNEHSATPFAYEGNVLGTLTESMVPRFFGALTDTEKLPTKKFKFSDLTAMQNRVDSAKVARFSEFVGKYDPDQPRDEKGRWGSGDAPSVSELGLGEGFSNYSGEYSGNIKHFTTEESAKEIVNSYVDAREGAWGEFAYFLEEAEAEKHPTSSTRSQVAVVTEFKSNKVLEFTGTVSSFERGLDQLKKDDEDYGDLVARLGFDSVRVTRTDALGNPKPPGYFLVTGAKAKQLSFSISKYDPNQPRDENGRWGSGGFSTSTYSPSEDDANIKLPQARLPAAGEPLKMYHVTYVDSANSILENGFDKDAQNQIQGFESTIQGTYGWATPERAKMEVGRLVEMGIDPDDFVIMELEVPASEFKNLKPDEDFEIGDNWKGSYTDLQSVAYQGSAPKEWIKGVAGSETAISNIKKPTKQEAPKLPPAKTPASQKRIDNLPSRHKDVLARVVADGNYNMSVNDLKQTYGVSDLDSKEVERISRLAYSFRKSIDKAIKHPLVVQLNGKLYIADGHHRATALWLAGEDELEAHFKDLDEMTNAVKSQDVAEVVLFKVDEDQRIVYGWANVITEKGQPVVDTQGDIIEADELVKATTDYMKSERVAKHNHRGDQIGTVLHSFPMTFEIAKSLGIDTKGREGWLTGMHIAKDELWEKVKKGELKAFSIGARAVRVPVG